ncbi:MAG: hypothetical protein ABI615_10400 [Chthoniobacterales bacterium]
MSDPLYNLHWEKQARALCISGTPVRRFWWNYWIVYDKFLFQININLTGANDRVVTAADFTHEDEQAGDWTTAPIATQDVCIAAIPPVIPSAFQFTADITVPALLTAVVGVNDLAAGDAWRVDIYNAEQLLGSVNIGTATSRKISLDWPVADALAGGVYKLTAVFSNTGAYKGLKQTFSATVALPVLSLWIIGGEIDGNSGASSISLDVRGAAGPNWATKVADGIILGKASHSLASILASYPGYTITYTAQELVLLDSRNRCVGYKAVPNPVMMNGTAGTVLEVRLNEFPDLDAGFVLNSPYGTYPGPFCGIALRPRFSVVGLA